MKLIAKVITAVQALLLAPMGAAKPGEAATPAEFNEAAGWEAATSVGTPEALQQFISRFPRGERLGEAFDLIVQNEIEAAGPGSADSPINVQLSEARRDRLEVLEHDFDRGSPAGGPSSNEDSGGPTPY